jgi:hypothetical protein
VFQAAGQRCATALDTTTSGANRERGRPAPAVPAISHRHGKHGSYVVSIRIDLRQLFGPWRSGKRRFTSEGRQNFKTGIGSTTAEKAKGQFAILEVDLVAVKGKTEPQTIYALLGREEIAGDIRFQELRKLYSTMMYCYRSRDWEGALEAIELCQSTEHNFGLAGLFDLYRIRIQTFRETAPPPDWTGIFVAETK